LVISANNNLRKEVHPLTVEVCEQTRIVYYWMTRQERDAKPTLKTEYHDWKSRGFKVCTFISGNESLVDLTKDLLKHNKEVIAKQNAPQCGEASAITSSLLLILYDHILCHTFPFDIFSACY